VIDGDASTHVPVYPSRLSKRFSRLMRRKGLTSIGSKDAQTDTTAPLIDALDGDRLPEVSAALKAEASREVDARTVGRPSPYGICLSGGGIRSAAFSLGVLQEMNKHGMLHGPKRADYLSSVSGGSYMAGAVAIVQRGRFPKTRAPTPKESKPPPDPIVPSTSMPAFAPGSPEETYLRDNTRYLTHGWGGPVAAIWRLFMGILWNLLILVLMVGLIFVALGWVYGLRLPSLQAHCASTALDCVRPHHFSFPAWVFVVAIAMGAAALLTGMLLVFRQWTLEGTRRVLLGASLALAAGPCFGFSRSWSFRFSWNGSAQVSVPANSEQHRQELRDRDRGCREWDQYGRRRADSLVRHQSLADGPGRMGRGSGWRQGGSRDPSKELAAASTCSPCEPSRCTHRATHGRVDRGVCPRSGIALSAHNRRASGVSRRRPLGYRPRRGGGDLVLW